MKVLINHTQVLIKTTLEYKGLLRAQTDRYRDQTATANNYFVPAGEEATVRGQPQIGNCFQKTVNIDVAIRILWRGLAILGLAANSPTKEGGV